MRARALSPFLTLFVPVVCLAGLAGSLLTLQGTPLAAVAIAVILGALFVLLLNPALALGLFCVTRYTFEMAWDQKVAGVGVLDLLGAGVPFVALVLVVLRRPALGRFPLFWPTVWWSIVLWCLAGIHIVAGGAPMPTLENTFRFTGGVGIFVLTLMVVGTYRQGLRILLFWLLGAIPVVGIFYWFGQRGAMLYHGVVRHKALYFDVVTPATVASLSLLTCLFFLSYGRRRRWEPWKLIGLGIAVLMLARMVFLTFSNAMAGVTILGAAMFLVLRRRYGVVCLLLGIVLALTQHPTVQKRWWREIEIAQGNVDPIGFASGRPNRWRRFFARYERAPLVNKVLGVHGAWGNPENQFLQLLFDLGPIGGAATLIFILYVALRLLRWWRAEGDPDRKLLYALVLSVAVGSLAGWFTMTMFCMINFQWWIFSMLGVCAALNANPSAAPAPPGSGPSPAPTTGPGTPGPRGAAPTGYRLADAAAEIRRSLGRRGAPPPQAP